MARVFVSDSHEDKPRKARVVKQLAVLAADGLEVWDDRRVAAGADWADEIARAIATCAVAVLLISADFLGTVFILVLTVPVGTPVCTALRCDGMRRHSCPCG